MPRIAIVGTGLIGGSLGLALKRSKIQAEIVGYSRDFRNAQQARKMGAIDRAEPTIAEAVADADLVIIAAPPLSIRAIFQEMAPRLKESCVVTDTASTKETVMGWAKELLPETVHFVGGHPMAGKEQSGIQAADANLFQGCVYCITPAQGVDPAAVESVVNLATMVGATPRFLDVTEHDSYVAAISHLPFLLSIALVNVTSGSTAWREMGRLAASGYRDVSRLASGDVAMHHGICVTNVPAVSRWLETIVGELNRMRTLMESDAAELEKVLAGAKQARDRWLVRPDMEEEGPPAPIVSAQEQMETLIFGKWLRGELPSLTRRRDKGEEEAKR